MISIVTASEKEKAQALNQKGNFLRCGGYMVRDIFRELFFWSHLERCGIEGDTPVQRSRHLDEYVLWSKRSRVAWECSAKSGGILHQRLNIYEKPIANKYREGKMKSTLKRGLKEPEVVGMEGIYGEY